MPIYDLYCECGYKAERIIYETHPHCPVCGKQLSKAFPLYAYAKIKGEGGYPSRRKQIRNTTYRNHPKLEREENTLYFGGK